MICLSVEDYVRKIDDGDHFALAGFGDAEWFCAIDWHIGEKTGAGQVLCSRAGVLLREMLYRRRLDPSFLVSTPGIIWESEEFAEVVGQIDHVVSTVYRDREFYERDMAFDDLARDAGLAPWIGCFRRHRVVYTGNEKLLPVVADLFGVAGSVEIPLNNLHLTPDKYGPIADALVDLYEPGTVYLFSAGISAALLVDRIWGRVPHCWAIDCGSMWDAFGGMGEARLWREALYKDPTELESWVERNMP